MRPSRRWLIGERRRFAALAEATLQEATLNALSVGNLDDGVRYASRLVTLNPLTDTHQELLIRAYAMNGDLLAARLQLESAVRLFRRELGCDPQPSVFLAAEAAPAKIDGPSTPARVRALPEAGQAQVTACVVDAAVQVLRAACEEADVTRDADLAATAHLALGSALIGAGTARHQEGEIALQRAINLAHQSGHRATAAAAYRNLAGSDVLRGIYPRADRRLAEAESLGSGEAKGSRGGGGDSRCQPARPWRHRRGDRRLPPRTRRRSRPGARLSPDHVDPRRAGLPTGWRLPHGPRAFGPGAADRTDTFVGGRHGGLASRCSVMSRWPPVIW